MKKIVLSFFAGLFVVSSFGTHQCKEVRDLKNLKSNNNNKVKNPLLASLDSEEKRAEENRRNFNKTQNREKISRNKPFTPKPLKTVH